MIKKYSKEAIVPATDIKAISIAEASLLLDLARFYVSIGIIKINRSFDGCEKGMIRLTAEGNYFDREGTADQSVDHKTVRRKKLQEPLPRTTRK